MYSKKIVACIGIVGATLATQLPNKAIAQDIHFTQFNMTPLVINPAFTGAFDGDLRASVIYRDQWRMGGDAVFKTYSAGFDMPVIRDISIDDYLAVGMQLNNDVAGDGNLSNFSALASVAYHKFLGTDGKRALTVGLQGGYMQKSFDLSKLYFGDEYIDGILNHGTTAEQLYNNTSNFVINAGLAWSHAVSEKFSYVLGAGVNNINQPMETVNKRKFNKDVGLAMRYTAQFGAIYSVNERFSVRPAILFQSQATASEIVGGSEFHYKLGEDYELPESPAIFAGVWYRHNDAVMGTVGLEWQSFRLGFAYDYTISDFSNYNNGNGGLEVSLRYIKPGALASSKRLIYPCGRF